MSFGQAIRSAFQN